MTETPTERLHREGKLEQMCRSCGRWEAAGARCSWCGAPTGESTWYRNNDLAERRVRLPPTPPADPPNEYRRTYNEEKGQGWPPQWGENPYKARSPRGTPLKGASE